MKKHKIIKALLAALFAVILAACALMLSFYHIKLKPRIDAVMYVWNALQDFAEDKKTLVITENALGTDIYVNGLFEDSLCVTLAKNDSVSIAAGYVNEGLWAAYGQDSDTYFMPWDDSVKEDINDSALFSLLGFSDEEKLAFADKLISVRHALLDIDEYEYTPSLLNRIFGLEDLKADILELYENIDFRQTTGQTYKNESNVTVYELSVPQKYVKLLLLTDGTGSWQKLGSLLGDAVLTVYVKDNTVLFADLDTTFLYMPKFLTGGDGEQLYSLDFEETPLNAAFDFDGENIQLTAEFSFNNTTVKLNANLAMEEAAYMNVYNEEKKFNLLTAGKLKLILKLAKVLGE